jgi:predicted dehydrogenase
VDEFHLPVLSTRNDIEIRWIVDKRLETAKFQAAKYGIPDARDKLTGAPDVDAVLVAVPVGARPPVMGEVIRRGWHALCEKPFAASAEEHRAYLDEARDAGVMLMAGLMRRFYWSTQMMARVTGSGILGSVTGVWAVDAAYWRRTGRGSGWYMSDSSSAGGGFLAESGSHLVDQILTITGASSWEIVSCRQKLYQGMDFETSISAHLNINGSQVLTGITISRLEDRYSGILVECERGSLRTGLLADVGIEICDPTGKVVVSLPSPVPAGAGLPGAFAAEWDLLVQSLGSPPSCFDLAGHTGLLTTAFINDCYRQTERSQVVA